MCFFLLFSSHLFVLCVFFFCIFFFFFFNDTATTEIYTLSLHDALPDLFERRQQHASLLPRAHRHAHASRRLIAPIDRKSTRLNSSHGYISYAVFCLKKKKKNKHTIQIQKEKKTTKQQ